jgi:peptidyl-prolyl cis-trans isomerase B (cyclophilin B)
VTPKPAVVQDSTLSLGSLSPTPSLSSETNSNKAVIKTDRGNIELILYPQDAPNTVANFVQKAKSGFYNNLIFHRVEDWVIQGGDPLGNGTGGGKIPTELNNKPFVVGSLGVARGQDINISNDAQFFITKKDSQFLNGQYANFGIVTKGMDVVNKIQIGDKIFGIEVINWTN